jgi:hypothetical protein
MKKSIDANTWRTLMISKKTALGLIGGALIAVSNLTHAAVVGNFNYTGEQNEYATHSGTATLDDSGVLTMNGIFNFSFESGADIYDTDITYTQTVQGPWSPPLLSVTDAQLLGHSCEDVGTVLLCTDVTLGVPAALGVEGGEIDFELGIGGITEFVTYDLEDFNSNPEDYETTAYILTTVNPVPVPAAAWLFGSAILGLGAVKRRKA